MSMHVQQADRGSSKSLHMSVTIVRLSPRHSPIDLVSDHFASAMCELTCILIICIKIIIEKVATCEDAGRQAGF